MHNIYRGIYMIYYAIIGDVKDSRTLPNRNDVQEKLKKVLLDINRIYNEDIAADFLITLGDEFQGLMLKSNNIIKIVKHIQRELHPIQIRFGIGIGEISTKINKKAAIGADGPAFYAARNVITMIHELEKKIKIQAPDIQISLYTEKNIFEIKEINTLLSLIKTIEDSWTEKQRYTVWDMMINHGSQNECALRMNTSQSTVARRLSDGKYIVYVNAINTVEEAISRLEENGVI